MKNRNLILASILLIITLISLLLGFYYQWHFEIRFYLGLFALVFTILAYFKIKGIANYLFGFILVLGLFDLIHFVPFSIGINFSILKIHLIPFVFLMIFYLLNRQNINEKIRNFNEPSDSEELSRENSQIEFFKIKFQNLSETEIDKKLKEDLVPEAIEALKILKDNLTAKNTK
jgi:hypothetical protein